MAAVGKEFLFAVREECRDLHPALQQVNPSARLPVAGRGLRHRVALLWPASTLEAATPRNLITDCCAANSFIAALKRNGYEQEDGVACHAGRAAGCAMRFGGGGPIFRPGGAAWRVSGPRG
ncbi:hypothetical protein THICB2_350028 [Thiomonas sp. CB2]|nr:hypothetical protein THICB2_350028 [Thiomonas sp. CB2]CQR42873.1 hypothetical protein THICB3310030 [Thiomonas sp. CB3]